MERSRWASVHIFLKMSLLSCALFLFLFGGIGESIETTYAMSSNRLLKLPLLPISILESEPAPTPTPASQPASNSAPASQPASNSAPASQSASNPPPASDSNAAPKPAPIPTSVAAQPSGAIPTQQVLPRKTATVLPTLTTTVIPATATSTKTPVSATPTSVATTPGATMIMPRVPPNLQLQGGMDSAAVMLSLILGVGIPLLLISGGVLWLLVKWQINRHTLAHRMSRGAAD